MRTRIRMVNYNQIKKDKGQFFTPKPIVKAVLKRVVDYFPIDHRSKIITVLDPAIGKGVFFSTLIPLISPLFPSVKLYGLDIDSSVIKIAEKELFPLVIESSYDIVLKIGNFFLDFPSDIPTKEFDVIIGNPPHNARYSRAEWKKIRENCLFGQNLHIYPESSIFFTLKSLKLLKSGGILCYLLPKPIIYSKRWRKFRKLLLTNYCLIEALDLGNQFSGQLQEQIVLILKKILPDIKYHKYQTGIWNPIEKKFKQRSFIFNSDALIIDNLLVGVNNSELEIIRRLYSNEFEFLNVNAFRGLSSKFREKNGTIPLIEKANIASGFLLPPRGFLKENTPKQRIMRQQIPKIIAQRIISYQTKPTYSLDVKTWVDQKGAVLTHETVINIIPNYPQEVLSLTAIAGLLKSSFIEWWLCHAVYTKEFVTSKDFDRAYINLIRIPHISDSKSIKYRERLSELLQFNQYEKILKEMKSQTDIDKFYTLGEFYSKYQKGGENLKTRITQLIRDKRTYPLYPRKTEFHSFRWFYKQLIKEKDINEIFQESTLGEQQASNYLASIVRNYKELQQLQNYIDEIAFSLYKITPNEQRLIKGESS